MAENLRPSVWDKRIGIFFAIVWIALFVFYLTWDGWVYEWRSLGLSGPNQHFDLNIFDMDARHLPDGAIKYISTNNIHSIIYMCFITILLGWTGLLTGNKWLKNGCVLTLPISVIAIFSTLNPITDHLYSVQIAYDVVHLSSAILGLYIIATSGFRLKYSFPTAFLTWALYILSRIFLEPSPYWSKDANGYFSLNQINDMPVYFYGLEYGIVVLILLGAGYVLQIVNSRLKSRVLKVLFPII